jgi:hypothetical protein
VEMIWSGLTDEFAGELRRDGDRERRWERHRAPAQC